MLEAPGGPTGSKTIARLFLIQKWPIAYLLFFAHYVKKDVKPVLRDSVPLTRRRAGLKLGIQVRGES